MDQQKVDMYLMANVKYFPSNKTIYIRERLVALDDNKFNLITMVELKDPTTLLLISIFLGTLGVDRFMLNDIGMGVLKLLTGGLCGILTIIDWINIQKMAQEWNFNNLMSALAQFN